MPQNHPNLDQAIAVGLMRRLAAMLYDSFLVSAVLIVASAAAYLPLAWVGLENSTGHPLWTLYFLLIAIGFFVWFWTHGGQTLGMRVWRIKLYSLDGGPVTYRQALIRALVAISSLAALGLGFIWCLFDAEKRTWHDIASGTRLIMLQKNKG